MIKSALVESSTLEERSVAHRRLADVLIDQPELRGHHLAQATHAPDAGVAAAIEAAAHLTLERGDVVGAVSKLIRAAELSPDREARGRRLADAAFIGAHSAGQLDRAVELLRDARRGDPGFDSTLHAAAATAYLLLNTEGDAGTAYHLLVDAIESALDESDPDLEGLAEGLYTLTLLCHYAARDDYWPAYHGAMSRLGPAAPMHVRLLAETLVDPVRASAETLRVLDEQVHQLESSEDDGVIVRVAIAAFYVDRLTQCREPLLRIIDDGRGGGAVGSAMMAMNIIAHEEVNAGRWDEAARYAAEAKTLWDDRGFRLYGMGSHYTLALIAANRGDVEACRRECDCILEWAVPRQLGIFTEWANHALARATLGSGEFEEAYAHASAITPPGTLLPHKPQALWSAFDLMDAAYRSGRVSEANAHAEALQSADIARLSARYALVADAATALVADDATAAAKFDTALAHPGIQQWPFDVARVQLAYGERLRRIRRSRDARKMLETARDTFESLGAEGWMRRAETELAATSAHRHSSKETYALSLTPHEREVAMLAATGLTNRQIASQLLMSPRTVSAHLYRVFPKLGITSRAALRDALLAREKLADP
ncbi:helix-turn-helix transcriptional regulator [Microbacterium ulmi]|uniref:Helix-turn-helix transcriptional regulator n=1 Tax=Microbacterium ulmi TaxID=179095 RepID=A0A7Y2M4Q4_9MICO|nr:helix-turn-helix transcriptional regulator [Microbacterium ulmi]NII69514.1 DNA-binding CsgD family transcriptional regulator [Microbacterium ulmi]NNH05058.1 helix-turn-helix transcriptional regulator [Microbacterium ulmi]